MEKEQRREIRVQSYRTFAGERWRISIGDESLYVSEEEMIELGKLIKQVKDK